MVGPDLIFKCLVNPDPGILNLTFIRDASGAAWVEERMVDSVAILTKSVHLLRGKEVVVFWGFYFDGVASKAGGI